MKTIKLLVTALAVGCCGPSAQSLANTVTSLADDGSPGRLRPGYSRMKMKYWLSLLALVALAANAANVINFDDVADGTVINTHYSGLIFTNPLAAGSYVFARYSASAETPPNVVSIGGNLFFDQRDGYVEVFLSSAAQTVSIDAAAVAPPEFMGVLTKRPYLQAFDFYGNYLGTVYYPTSLLPTTSSGQGPWYTLSFTSSTQNVWTVVFSSEPPGGGNPTYGKFDNFSWSVGPPANDIGLRAYDGTGTIKIACEVGTATSPLRISKNGTTYGILLVTTNAANASRIRILTSSGIKAMQQLP
jgi:hypothetical protein